MGWWTMLLTLVMAGFIAGTVFAIMAGWLAWSVVGAILSTIATGFAFACAGMTSDECR